jgi:hypothetical protein
MDKSLKRGALGIQGAELGGDPADSETSKEAPHEQYDLHRSGHPQEDDRHCQVKTLRDILNWERCGSCARLGHSHFSPDRE